MEQIEQIIARQEEEFSQRFNRMVHYHRGEVLLQSADGSFPISQNEKGEFTTNQLDAIKDWHSSSIKEILEGVKQEIIEMKTYTGGSSVNEKDKRINKSDTINYIESIINKVEN